MNPPGASRLVASPGPIQGSWSSRFLLGTPLEMTTYSRLVEQCREGCKGPSPIAVEFSNTQIVVMRRHQSAFRAITSSVDHFVPDGMPLIWCLNLVGGGLRDRVYGPTFMRRCLREVPPSVTHYLVGGSEECVQRLRQIFFSPADRDSALCGSYTGPCSSEGILPKGQDEALVETINRLSPDFIWVGLGTPKQQAWIHRNKSRIRRGVILGVGFAFDVNAGMKPDAPGWMQRLGLTWLFRLSSEPRRLLPRYLRYNSLFIFYVLWDGLRGRLFAPPKG